MSAARTFEVAGRQVRRGTVLWGALLVNTELLLLGSYLAITGDRLTSLTPLLPWVWINVGIWAFVRTDPPASSGRRRTAALALATAYVGLLAYFGGLWGQPDPALPYGVTLSAFSAPPGWAPRLFVNTPLVRVHLIPFKAVGYLALGYLVYATVLEAAGSAVTGVLGLLSCVSCTWPIVATLLAGTVGGSAAMAEAAIGYSYPISTVVFVATVGLLVWRPGWG